MPKSKQNPEVVTRLTEKAYQRLEELRKKDGITQAEIVRRAILTYLKGNQTAVEEHLTDRFEKRLKAIEDRFAGLLVRIGFDIGTIYSVLYARTDQEIRDKLFDRCYQLSVRRFNQKLKAVAGDLKVQLADMADKA